MLAESGVPGRRQDALVIEYHADASGPHTRRTHFKDTPNNGCSFLIDNQLMLIIRMPQVAVGVQRPQVLTALCFGVERGLDFRGNISCVHIVRDILIK